MDRLRRLADRIVATQLVIDGADFIELYRWFLDRSPTPEQAFESSRRIFRGAPLTGGTPFTKDCTYLSGFLAVTTFIRSAFRAGRADTLGLLFAGKLDLFSLPALGELRSMGLVKPAVPPSAVGRRPGVGVGPPHAQHVHGRHRRVDGDRGHGRRARTLPDRRDRKRSGRHSELTSIRAVRPWRTARSDALTRGSGVRSGRRSTRPTARSARPFGAGESGRLDRRVVVVGQRCLVELPDRMIDRVMSQATATHRPAADGAPAAGQEDVELGGFGDRVADVDLDVCRGRSSARPAASRRRVAAPAGAGLGRSSSPTRTGTPAATERRRRSGAVWPRG